VKISKRKLAVGGGLLLFFFLLGYTVIYLVVRSEGLRARVESELSARTGYEVKITALRLTPWLALAASGISVSKDGQLLLQGERAVVFFSPRDFFYRRISHISLEQPMFPLYLQDLFNSSEGALPRLSIGALNIEDGEIVLETGQGKPLALRSIFLRARNLNLGGETGLELRADVPAVKGSARLSVSGAPEARRIEIVLDQEEEGLMKELLPKTAEKKTALKAGFQIRRDNDGYEVEGTVGSDRFPAKLLPAAMPLDLGAVNATFKGNYSPEKNTLALKKVNLVSAMGTLNGEGAVALGGTPIGLNATLRLRDLPLEALKPLLPAPFSALVYRGKVAGDLNLSGAYNDPAITGLAWNDGAQVSGEKISIAQLSLKIPFQWAHSLFQIKTGRVQGKDFLFGAKGETQLKIPGASLQGDLTTGPQKPLELAADFQILNGGFSISGESKVGEHLNVKGGFTCRDCAGDAAFTGEARVESLELLWNKFFGDFKDQKPVIKVEGSYRRNSDEVALNPLQVSLDSVGRLQLIGSVRHLLADPAFQLEARTDDLRHAGFYDFFIRDTFKASYPVLGQIALAGQSRLAVRAEGSRESFTVEGRLRFEQGEIQERTGRWRVGPMALDLPLRLRFPQAPKEIASVSPPIGRFSIHEIKTPSSTIPEVNGPLVLWNNSLRFPEAIPISLFGGSCRIEKLAWSDVVGAPSELSFSLGLNGLQLLDLTEALGWYRFGGTLSGSIPEVQLEGDSLRSNGSITLNMFGGRIAIGAMEVQRHLSPVRSIKMTAMLEGLDLEQASATFEFGRISGVLAGTVEDLVITQGQPSEFKADIQTVEKPGVSQWISVEALNKITVLSSGNEAGLLYSGLAGFFDFFRYSKLGFKATLKNDKIKLRGIETRGGQEFLVVGTLLPPTVNIVSHSQEIGFSELLRRFERVKETESSGSSVKP